MAIRRVDDQQLRFELELDEAEEDALQGSISYEEAQRRSQAARALWEHGGIGGAGHLPKWFADYLKLVELGWPWRIACYIAWASSPKIDRWPDTLKDLAEKVLGLSSPRVIYIWRQKHPAIDQMVVMWQSAEFFEHRRDAFETLYWALEQKDYKYKEYLKLYFEMSGDYVPRSQIDVGRSAKGSEQDLSDEELRGLVGNEIAPSQAPRNDEPEDGEDADK